MLVMVFRLNFNLLRGCCLLLSKCVISCSNDDADADADDIFNKVRNN